MRKRETRPSARRGRRSRSSRASRAPSPTGSCRSTCQPLAPASRPWIGSPLGSRLSGRASEVEVDVSARHREAPLGEPVGPRVKQRDPHRRALRDVGAHAAPLAQQLLPAVAQRAADHPGVGDERRLDARLARARQRQRGEPLHHPFADHRHAPWGTHQPPGGGSAAEPPPRPRARCAGRGCRGSPAPAAPRRPRRRTRPGPPVRVALAPAPSLIVSVCGSRYGYWATPQPQITATTAPTASGRAPRRSPRHSSASTPSPHSAESDHQRQALARQAVVDVAGVGPVDEDPGHARSHRSPAPRSAREPRSSARGPGRRLGGRR